MDINDKDNYIINSFIYNYFYNSASGLYIYYDCINFNIINESDVIFNIFIFISKSNHKFVKNIKKIKSEIKNRIKRRNITDCIPESITLHNVLGYLSPNIFNETIYSKYFLICLGDIILKKNQNLFFIDRSYKKFLQIINDNLCIFFQSTDIMKYFKYIYKGNNKDKCRVIESKKLNLDYIIHDYKIMVNLICVAIHYSTRYKDSDEYVDDLDYIYSSKINTIKSYNIYEDVDNFISYYIKKCDTYTVNFKDMYFLWKMNCNDKFNLYNKSQVLEILKSKIKNVDDTFIDITSDYLPNVRWFKSFWDLCVIKDDSDSYEIDEIYSLYPRKININNFTKLINYYYPDLVIENGKTIVGVKCLLWDKKKDIKKYMDPHKNVDELYLEYTKKAKRSKIIVDKQYFKNYYNTIYE